MKKSRKLLALVLAMIMAFSLMAVTASAYDAGHEHDCAVCSEEGIEPKGSTGPVTTKQCAICGSLMVWEDGRYVCYNNHAQRMPAYPCPRCHTGTCDKLKVDDGNGAYHYKLVCLDCGYDSDRN